MTVAQAGDELAAAGTAAALLAHFWSRPVEAEVAQWQAWEGEVAATARALGPAGTGPALDLGPEPGSSVEDLLEDYERLFVGPGPVPCPPYESPWRMDVPLDVRHSLMGPCVAELTTIYARMGIEFDSGGGEMADYLPAELEALAHALATGDTGAARGLLDEHLLRWLSRFCREVARHARAPFYRSLSELTLAWVPAIRDQIGTGAPA